jgi:hypothetical protein
MPYNLTHYAYSIFTATCASGEGIQVTAEGSAESIISQRDADRKAEDFARTLAISRLNCLFPPAPDEIRYYSEAVSVSGICSAGSADPIGAFDPNKVFTVTLPAGSVYSTVSVEDANAAAAARAQAELLETLARRCETYYPNEEQSATAECVFPDTGSANTATIPAGDITSFISLEVANELAQSAALAAAQAGLACTPGVYNQAVTVTRTCALYMGGVKKGPDVSVTVPAGQFSEPTQFLADAAATAAATAEADALLALSCVYDYANVARLAVINCEDVYELQAEGSSSAIVPANLYFSNVDQTTVDNIACDAAWAEALANLSCYCPAGCVEKLVPPTATCTAP